MSNKIDIIKMIRQIREKNYEEIKNKTNEEIIWYFRNKSKEILNEIKNQSTMHST